MTVQAVVNLSYNDQDGQIATITGGDGVISLGDFSAYFDVIGLAFDVHIDREQIRHGLWKEYPAMDQMNQVKIKADRVWRSLEIIGRGAGNPAIVKNVLEELPDIINYAVFAHRIVNGKI